MVLDSSAGPPVFGLLLLVLTALYFLPTIVAFDRHHRVGVVLAMNFFLGWTLIGWAVAMDVATSAQRQSPVVTPELGANQEPAAPAGWYPDPEHPGQERLWQGTSWTNDLRPAGGGSTPPTSAT
jgi:hypothetical protein